MPLERDTQTQKHLIKLHKRIQLDKNANPVSMANISDYLRPLIEKQKKKPGEKILHPSIQTAYETLVKEWDDHHNRWDEKIVEFLGSLLNLDSHKGMLGRFQSTLRSIEASLNAAYNAEKAEYDHTKPTETYTHANGKTHMHNSPANFMELKINGAMAGHGYSDGNAVITADEWKELKDIAFKNKLHVVADNQTSHTPDERNDVINLYDRNGKHLQTFSSLRFANDKIGKF